MKYWIKKLTITICVTLLLGWVSIDKALADRKITDAEAVRLQINQRNNKEVFEHFWR
jgi:hypothetical protein